VEVHFKSPKRIQIIMDTSKVNTIPLLGLVLVLFFIAISPSVLFLNKVVTFIILSTVQLIAISLIFISFDYQDVPFNIWIYPAYIGIVFSTKAFITIKDNKRASKSK